MKYVHKPAVIEAVMFDGGNSAEILNFMGVDPSKHQSLLDGYVTAYRSPQDGFAVAMLIPNRQGTLKAYKGDYVVKDEAGEYYVISGDRFASLYEELPQ